MVLRRVSRRRQSRSDENNPAMVDVFVYLWRTGGFRRRPLSFASARLSASAKLRALLEARGYGQPLIAQTTNTWMSRPSVWPSPLRSERMAASGSDQGIGQREVRAVRGAACSAALVMLAGCDLFMPFVPPPVGMTVIPGGITDTRPYYGRVASADAPQQELGDFLLASCGCGDWRTLVALDDGSEDASLVTRFYGADAYIPTGPVTAYADEEAGSLRGELDQDTGRAGGRLQLAARRMTFEATRGENHSGAAGACLMCHFGDDPVRPLADTHTTDYQLEPPNCLDCHDMG